MKKVKRIFKSWLFLFFVILLLISTGCAKRREYNAKAEKVKEEALDYLRETYGEEFVIKHVRYISATGVWELTAAPCEEQDFLFFIRTGGTFGDLFMTSYSRLRLQAQANKYYEPVVNQIFGKKQYFFVTMATDAEYDLKNPPSFEELLEFGAEETYVNIFIYIFEDVIEVKEKKEKFLASVMELLEYLRGQNLMWGTIQASIYDERFFKDKDIEHILKVSDWFYSGTDEFDVLEYRRKQIYGLRIGRTEFHKIKSIEDLEKKING